MTVCISIVNHFLNALNDRSFGHAVWSVCHPFRLQDPDSIERVLRAIGARCRARGLPWQAPELAVARAPPEIWG